MAFDRSTALRDVHNTARTGAVSELLACAYLMAKGYYVFRAQSPSSPIDLIIYDRTRCIRVEVKTVSADRRYGVPTYNTPRNDEWDLLIVVGSDGHCFEFQPGKTYTDNINFIRQYYGVPHLRTPTEPRPCSQEGCPDLAQVKGLCSKHYQADRYLKSRKPVDPA